MMLRDTDSCIRSRYAYDHFGTEWGNGVGPQGYRTQFSIIELPVIRLKSQKIMARYWSQFSE